MRRSATSQHSPRCRTSQPYCRKQRSHGFGTDMSRSQRGPNAIGRSSLGVLLADQEAPDLADTSEDDRVEHATLAVAGQLRRLCNGAHAAQISLKEAECGALFAAGERSMIPFGAHLERMCLESFSSSVYFITLGVLKRVYIWQVTVYYSVLGLLL